MILKTTFSKYDTSYISLSSFALRIFYGFSLLFSISWKLPPYWLQMYQTTNRGVHQATHSYNQNDDGVTNEKRLQILAIEIHHDLTMLLKFKN